MVFVNCVLTLRGKYYFDLVVKGTCRQNKDGICTCLGMCGPISVFTRNYEVALRPFRLIIPC